MRQKVRRNYAFEHWMPDFPSELKHLDSQTSDMIIIKRVCTVNPFAELQQRAMQVVGGVVKVMATSSAKVEIKSHIINACFMWVIFVIFRHLKISYSTGAMNGRDVVDRPANSL
jgi:hypothetical protein